ncbi:MAG: hypothetical protein PWR12_888, partial [Eubacteriaceae bacterium]|nr:hypothetical protein [Eubacteriaceae bacterium]
MPGFTFQYGSIIKDIFLHGNAQCENIFTFQYGSII